MSIDPVAVYAAVVATGALGWQVYQWRSERRGKLDVTLSAQWQDDDHKFLNLTLRNTNDYPVRLQLVRLRTLPLGTRGDDVANPGAAWTPRYLDGEAAEVRAHDNLFLTLDACDLAEKQVANFRPGYIATVLVKNTLGNAYAASAPIVEGFFPVRPPGEAGSADPH
jgi:hypothetical protein